jgi:hypothetical protein
MRLSLPHATHAGGRDREPALSQLVGDADLAEAGCSMATTTSTRKIDAVS